jgi:phospholipase/carboxylesterase
MNRLSTLSSPPKNALSAPARPPKPALLPKADRDLPQCLLAPLHYERNYAYPLLVWLHGSGGDERELRQIMPLISLRNYVSLSVRGTAQHRHGYDWRQTPEAIDACELRLLDAVAHARQRFHIHQGRIFVAGYGSGGTMAIRLALRSPGLFAGAASMGGPFPSGHAPLARLEQLRQQRLLIAHCRDSLHYQVDCVCRELALFHAAGMSVTLRQYPCGDELTTQMLHDLDIWLMEQVTGIAADQAEPAPLPSDWN